MAAACRGPTAVSLGSTEEIGLRLVSGGRFVKRSEACRAGLRRLADDEQGIDRLVAFGEEGMASGVDEGVDIDAFIKDGRRNDGYKAPSSRQEPGDL